MGSYFWAMAVVSVYTLAALRPLHRPPFGFVSFMLGYLLNELPFIAFAWVLAWTLSALSQGDLASTGGLAGLGLAVVTTLGLVEIVRRGSLAGEAVEHSLDRDAGPGLRSVRGSGDRPRWRRLARVLFTPLPLWSRDVQRIRNIRYGDAGRRHRLDLYRPRSRPEGGSPVFVHFHGGHFRGGGKSREARPLLYRLASRGWLCASANYRLREAGRFPRSLVDAKQAIAWLRRHGAEHGADASLLVVGGCQVRPKSVPVSPVEK